MTSWPPRLLLPVVCRFDTRDLENGDVNLICRMLSEAYRHMVVALTEELKPALRERLRLVLVGDGPLRAEAQSVLARRWRAGPGLGARRARRCAGRHVRARRLRAAVAGRGHLQQDPPGDGLRLSECW